MARPKAQTFYLGNKNLPEPETTFQWTPEMVEDLEKCRKSILHFAKYFYIVNLDEGKQPIKLYTYQKRLLKALVENRFNVVLASRQIGKALALDTPIPTPNGWTTMGELKSGDQVYGFDGNPCNVTKAHDVLNNRDCYKVTFDNGECITADSEHLWFTESKSERKTKGSVKSTKQIFDTLQQSSGEPNHRVPACINGVANSYKELPKGQSEYCSQWHYITNVEKTESVPVRCITVDSKDCLYLCGKQYIPTHNTTVLTIFALWMVCFNEDYRVLLIANKQETAKNIFKRVKLAYEMLPNFLKPGVITYAKEGMELGNGSSIGISTTTSDAARGESINCVLLDEVAFIDPSFMDDFWESVFPVISSSKKSKVFMLSTPNGVGNLFYNTYTDAVSNKNGWHHERVDWWEVPGRDEKWKELMTRALGSQIAFDQEYGNLFRPAGENAMDEDQLKNLESGVIDPILVDENGEYKIYKDRVEYHFYSIGVDVGEGIGRANSVVQVTDITDLTCIEQVAIYASNRLDPFNFTAKLVEIAKEWGSPPIVVERNNCGAQVVDALVHTHHYENLIKYTPSMGTFTEKVDKENRLGVFAHTNSKYNSMANLRYWLTVLNCLKIYDLETVNEFKTYIRNPNGTWKKQSDKYLDDRVEALIWSLFVLDNKIVEQFYEVLQTDGNGKPLKIAPLNWDPFTMAMPPSRLEMRYKQFSKDKNQEPMSIRNPVFMSGAPDNSTDMDELLESGWRPTKGQMMPNHKSSNDTYDEQADAFVTKYIPGRRLEG